MLSFTVAAAAQEPFYGIANHLSVGVSAGTQGGSLSVGTNLTRWVGVRAGLNVFPSLDLDYDADVTATVAGISREYPISIGVDAKRTTFDAMVDFYPLNWLSVTAGFGVGGSTLAKLDGHCDDIASAVGDAAVYIKDYELKVDANGDVHGGVKVKSFRPYLGLGFGCRAVPKKRVGVRCDLGAFFHGKPEIYSGSTDDVIKISQVHEDSDLDEVMDKLNVYPHLKVTVIVRLL